MSTPYLVYRCTKGDPIKKPEAVIMLWEDDVPRATEILDEACGGNPKRVRKENEYWEIVPKQDADPYDWNKVTAGMEKKAQAENSLAQMWKDRHKAEKIIEAGGDPEEALEAVTPLKQFVSYKKEMKKL